MNHYFMENLNSVHPKHFIIILEYSGITALVCDPYSCVLELAVASRIYGLPVGLSNSFEIMGTAS